MPIVSVVIPTYNRASMVKEAIKSVLDQTYSDYEVIVVDDGSTDNTREVVNSFSDTRIRYVFQENRERSAARNHALSLARGRYIAFLDSDDVFLPTKLEKQVTALEKNPKFGMVYSSAICTDKQGRRIPPYIYKATVSGWIYRKVAFYVPVTIMPTLVMLRSEVLSEVGGFDKKMTRFEDVDMWRRVAQRYPILAMPEPLCIFRTHSDNELASQDPEKILRAIEYYVKKVFHEDREQSPIFRRQAAARLYLHYGIAVLVSPKWHNSARPFIAQSIKYWPFQIVAYPFFLATYVNRPPISLMLRLLPRLRAAWLKRQNRIEAKKDSAIIETIDSNRAG